MHPGFERRLRPIAVIILFFFSWFCIEPWNYALAAQSSPLNLPDTTGNQQKAQTVSDIFQEDLREIKANIRSITEEASFQERLVDRLKAFQAAAQEERQALNLAREGMKRLLKAVHKKKKTDKQLKDLERQQNRLRNRFNQVHFEGAAIKGLLREMALPARLQRNHRQFKAELIVQNKKMQNQFQKLVAQVKKKKAVEKSRVAFMEASVAVEEGLERFQDVLESMVSEATPKKRRLQILTKVLEKEEGLDQADRHIRNTFDRTRQNLLDRGLPQVILDRHREAVQTYEKNFKHLRTELGGLRQLNQAYISAIEVRDLTAVRSLGNELMSKSSELDRFLKENVKEPPSTPLDPEKLPHRTPKVKKRKPRLKKEEFTEFQKPVQLAFNGDPSTMVLAQATSDLPTPQDLAENIEVQFTQEIVALAASLENNPVKIYNWVRNNIDFVPTWGSIQGADHCLLTKECNAMDTASLLVALLRTSGVSARYAMGTIKVPIDQIMNWVGGFTDEASALNFISSGGVPITGLISGGNITSSQFEHTWVEAYVDYIPSRGAVHKQGDTWIPLDASFKQYTFTEGLDLQAVVPFDTDAFIAQVESTATINETESFVASVDTTFIQTTFTDLQTQIDSYLEANLPNTTVGDLIGEKTIINKAFPFLSATLPYQKVVSGNSVSTLSDSLRHRVTFEVTTEAFFGADMNFSASLPELAGRRVTLSYVPASTSDQQTIDSYGGLYETPAYLIQVKPQLKIEGVITAEGGAVGMGDEQNFTMIFSLPNVGADQIQNKITAGGYYAIGLVSDRLPENYSSLIQKRAQQFSNFIENGGERDADAGLGEQLYLTTMTYFWEVDRQTDALASQMDILYVKQPGEGISGLSLLVSNLFGIPRAVEVTGTYIDVDRTVYISKSKTGNSQSIFNFTNASGWLASGTEHGILEQMYDVDGISSVKALQLANVRGLNIYQISSENLASVLPILQVSSETKTNIQNAVNAGKEILIPERELIVNNWIGIGYVVSDPVTAEAAYLISGGTAGGTETITRNLGDILAKFEGTSAVLACLLAPNFLPRTLFVLTLLIAGVFVTPSPIAKIILVVFIVITLLAIYGIIKQCIEANKSAKFFRDKLVFYSSTSNRPLLI